ncbi:nipped-B-like protein isoform X1 [Rhopalosiphum maidis]|uniref:nipped-B-like protein isoform X1 n=2 Tax=Rhopalosiphum maidis TaxID=43146 RepID=UPI000F001B4C|nr:nipped-B-like protein isoform X1 [Rhopalosiphum maidis]XP_026815898.1 nipped-B-like protein isoform X1 [Rhopalosiphum maidis]
MYRPTHNSNLQYDLKVGYNDGHQRTIAMNGEIPSVPITTLAGISSLTDLLPEMPLPSPMPQTLGNKSLLFHPRVAEEADILLSLRDDTLVPQLIQSLINTSSDHIQLKDKYMYTEHYNNQQNIPELLKAILHQNANVFRGPPAIFQQQQEKEKNIETKTVHELNEINSFESALIEQHDLSHNELLQQSEILNELPHQQQPVIVRTPPAKLSRLLLDEEENDKINVQNLERQFSQITNNYDVFLNQPTISLTRIDLSQHVVNKKNMINMEELTEDNDFGLALAERPSITNQDKRSFPSQVENESSDPNDFGVSLTERIKRRKRAAQQSEVNDKNNSFDENECIIKPKLRKVERKFVPAVEKLSVEELMETNTYQKFNKCIEKVFESTEEVDTLLDFGENDIPPEALIPKYVLQELCSESAKLKTLGAMESIPSNKIIRILSILEKNIRDGAKVSPIADPEDDECERKLWMELAMERVMRAVDASLTTLYVLTSPRMQKKVYMEDVIDRVVMFTKYQLHNTIYPAFDPVYRIHKSNDSYAGSARKKRAHPKEVRDKNVLSLYTKLAEVVSLLAELLQIQTLTDTAVLHTSSMAVSPFFVEEISELQLSALKLVTTIFTKYDKHRKLLLDDILASMARLPSSKRSLKSFRISSEEYIQMLSALVLQLIQCMVVLPSNLADKQSNLDPDTLIISKFKTARSTASSFLHVFLSKCSSKSEEIDYRPIFENFIQDLLTTVNKPEWPASELMLSVLGRLLVANFVNKNLDMSLRVASLDYLGVVAARLRKDSVTSQLRLKTIDSIIMDIRTEELKDEDGNLMEEVQEVQDDEERIQFLQRVLLDYLAIRSLSEPALRHARHFYLAQWYQDNTDAGKSTDSLSKRKKEKQSRKKFGSDDEDDGESSDSSKENESRIDANKAVENSRLCDQRKEYLLTKINPYDNQSTQVMQTYIDYDSAELVARYLASKRPFSQSFDTYLKHIIKVLMETSVNIRTKAMKCLTMIVEVDPGVLGLKEMQLGVSHSFLDHSTSVREAAVDLVGKFVLSRPELIDKYYDMLSTRILDTGVSVRKRVIKIMKDICIECPDYPKIPEICVKMIRRVNDEDGIKKLVMEVFQNMWFTPVREKPTLDTKMLLRKVLNITDVVAASKELGLEWFEQLLLSLFKPKEDKDDTAKVSTEPPKALLTACKQIVDCLVENVVTLDGGGGGTSQQLVACLTTLYLFAKIRPQLLATHSLTLQPYLSLKCQTQGDYQIISCVARTLELVVPLIEHPSEIFLSQLEEDAVKLIMKHDQTVILSCISCLGSVVNNVTRNFKLIRDCFGIYYKYLSNFQKLHQDRQTNPQGLIPLRPIFRRSIYIIGLMLRFFDFTDKDVYGDAYPDNIRDLVYDIMSYFMHTNEDDTKLFALKAIGSICIRHYDFMLCQDLMNTYLDILSNNSVANIMKSQILNNIEIYLEEEEKRMIKQDLEWSKMSKKENLKEMGDVSSGMASTVIQLYLKGILNSFLHTSVQVRQAVLKVIQLILAQGLVHPVQIVPYLICMSTDTEKSVSSRADKHLQEIEKKYPGFIHMGAQNGIKLSFQLQSIVQTDGEMVRGYRLKENDTIPSALNGCLYSILRTKQQRRALVLSILKQFEDQGKTNLAQMLYLADNLAYFPFQSQDEPLFIIHHINTMISVNGTNLLQNFREGLLPNPNAPVQSNKVEGGVEDEEDEDEGTLVDRVPDDITNLQEVLIKSQGCLLLLVLKLYLKTVYGITDLKITQYSPSESSKMYDKNLSRKSNSKFNPKATIQKLKYGLEINTEDLQKAKSELIAYYLELKHLIINLDPDDEGNEDAGTPKASKSVPSTPSNHVGSTPTQIQNTPNHNDVSNVSYESPEYQKQNNVQSTPKVPKLTIIPPKPPSSKHSHHHHRSHKSKKADRPKKHHHKRKKAKGGGSSEDSDNVYSDPDFLI